MLTEEEVMKLEQLFCNCPFKPRMVGGWLAEVGSEISEAKCNMCDVAKRAAEI